MTEYHTNDKEEIDITKEEFEQIKDAFKKEEFRKMFSDYVEEINDPKNRALYESEITQLEKERGIDVTFIHPTPGYVIKTSVNGSQKGFINVCSNEKIKRPTSQPTRKGDSVGLDWSLPYIQAPPRTDFDKNMKKCVVYDIVFHPDTLHLASKNLRFKKFVNDTALAAVEENFKVSLDKTNIRFPKVQYKGYKEATVMRKKSTNATNDDDDEPPMHIPNYPYPTLESDPVPKVVSPKEEKLDPYNTPKYVIKHRKGIEMHEFTNELDAKMYAATPTELVVVIDLPLIKSASDVALDVYKKSLSLISEKPARYKLDINLPWEVDENNGGAKFDKTTKKLHVNLPVVRKKYKFPEAVREDSGIESDPSQSVKSSSEEDISESIIEDSLVCKSTDTSVNETYRTREENSVKPAFLNPDYHYSFPSYVLNVLPNKLAIVFYVKNIDLQTVNHKVLENSCGIQISFTSIGSGFFSVHYAFCLRIPEIVIEHSAIKYDSTDGNLVFKFDFESSTCLREYYVGSGIDSLKKECISEPENIINTVETEEKNGIMREILSIDKDEYGLTVSLSKLSFGDSEDVKEAEEPNNLVDQDQCYKVCPRKDERNKGKISSRGNLKKSRTLSECGFLVPQEIGRRSILKCSRSLSESNVDDYSAWSSVDSSDSCIPEEISNGHKKTVRFNDVITEKIFRANSSILGQRKKNQRKSRNKKRAQERRASESGEEASGSEMEMGGDSSNCEESSVSETSEASSEEESSVPRPESIPSSKMHRRRGSKNKRKNAATAKHNNIFCPEE